MEEKKMNKCAFVEHKSLVQPPAKKGKYGADCDMNNPDITWHFFNSHLFQPGIWPGSQPKKKGTFDIAPEGLCMPCAGVSVAKISGTSARNAAAPRQTSRRKTAIPANESILIKLA
ncbi:hypothetical protein [Hymenobacter negativus]|uniref:Uncharacterized protein n=1 Tax=Hymenobacter negativus TaxID=2795026 RepID=A0ABS3Q9A3_9BACT|nr:hypothetical protein [Hymenobacter negativus]MBO2007593.1 hypothetical protein [Hymenobacter negativus]